MTRETFSTWNEPDQPDYKIIAGSERVTDFELLAVIAGKTTNPDILRESIRHYGDIATMRQQATIDGMIGLGLSAAQARRIYAALALSTRTTPVFKQTVRKSEDMYQLIKPYMFGMYEQFYIVLLNRANKVISIEKISEGGMFATVVDPKRVFKIALEKGACRIILTHNHPSGNTKASDGDIRITARLVEAGRVLEISVLDHLIVAGDQYMSFADEGMM